MRSNLVLYGLIFVLFFVLVDVYAEQSVIPSWVKTAAKLWSKNQIDDSGFVKIMQYLIEQDIIKIPNTQIVNPQDHVPGWVKHNAGWWADDVLGDSDFLKSIQYLVSANIIQLPSLTGLSISSTAFEDHGTIPIMYTCDGSSQSPPLSISNVPKGTQSLVLIVDDPDAKPQTFVHWIVWNIPPSKALFSKDEKIQFPEQLGRSGLGTQAYVGPCPPSGIHHYFFKLYALDETLQFDNAPDKKEIENSMQGHIISNSTLLGLYSRG